MKSVNVVIVGAGISGIAAASRLISNGIDDIVVLEGQDRLGGRIWSKPFGENCVDVGAHWIHGQGGNSVYQLVKKMGITKPSADEDKALFMTSNRTKLDVNVASLLYMKWSKDTSNDKALLKAQGSLYDYLKPRYESWASKLISNDDVRSALFECLQKFECTLTGCNTIKEASAPGSARFKDCKGNFLVLWKKDGYASLIEILLNRHPKCTKGTPIQLEEKTELNCRVTEINWSGEKVIVKCENGDLYEANHVIVTSSLGYLKGNYKEMFTPPLPKTKENAINSFGFGVIAKVYLLFPNQWWPDKYATFLFLETNPEEPAESKWEKGFMGFTSDQTAPNVLCGWLVGEEAIEMEKSTDRQVIDGTVRALRRYLGGKYEIPEPIDMQRSQWYSNPFVRGAYGYPSLESEELKLSAEDLAQPLCNESGKQVVLFAGEATHPHFFSSVHGAMETGWREADRILAMS